MTAGLGTTEDDTTEEWDKPAHRWRTVSPDSPYGPFHQQFRCVILTMRVLFVGVITMTATRVAATSSAPVVLHPAGTILNDEFVHVIENTFNGPLALCGAGGITRSLRFTFEAAGRDACEECTHLLAETGSTPQRRDAILL